MCTGEYRRSQINFILDGILVNAAIILTSGMFLSGYLVYLEAPDFLVGLLNNAGAWALIISLFSFMIYERMENRKALLITLNIVSRVLICSIVYLPLFIQDDGIVIRLITMMVIAGNLIWGVYSTGITVWMISLLPHKKRSNYIYARMFYLRISFTLTTIIAGRLIDYFNKSYRGFLITYTLSLILSILDAIILMKTDEPPNKVNGTAKFKLDDFLAPLRNREFAAYLMFVFFFYMSFTLSSSFTALYQIRYLNLDYSFISSINVITYIIMILCTKFWGRVERNRGVQFMLAITATFIVFELLIYSFIDKNTVNLLYLAAIASGIGNSGFNIGVATYRYDITPDENKTVYEGWFGAVYGISTIIGPILGNLIREGWFNVDFKALYRISFIATLVITITIFFKPKDIKSYGWNIGVNLRKLSKD